MRIYFLLFFSLLALPVFAAKYSKNNILKINTFLSSESEKILIDLEKKIVGDPISTFEEGLLRIFLNNTTFEDDLKYVRINDRFIRAIRTIQEGKSTIVEFSFADPSFKVGKKIKFTQKGKTLIVQIRRKEDLESKEEPIQYLKQKTKKTAEKFPEEDLTTFSFVKMLLALGFVLAILYLLLWLYQKFVMNRFGNPSKNHKLKIISSYHLGPKQKVVILDVNQRNFLCGVAPNNISLISEIEPWERLAWKKYILQNQDSLNIPLLRQEFENHKKSNYPKASKTKNLDTLDKQVEPKKKFGDELIHKIQNMREID